MIYNAVQMSIHLTECICVCVCVSELFILLAFGYFIISSYCKMYSGLKSIEYTGITLIANKMRFNQFSTLIRCDSINHTQIEMNVQKKFE